MTQHDESPSGVRRYLEELLACRGVEGELVLRSRFGFMAFHGGSLEPLCLLRTPSMAQSLVFPYSGSS
jgi:hypothetical protein